MSRAGEFRERAQRALRDPGADIETAWMERLPPSHQLTEDEDVVAISTKGARRHASQEEILGMAGKLLAGDWGEVGYEEDIEQNQANHGRDQGVIFGIYPAQDGKKLWAMQGHRFVPPTVMLSEER